MSSWRQRMTKDAFERLGPTRPGEYIHARSDPDASTSTYWRDDAPERVLVYRVRACTDCGDGCVFTLEEL